MNEALRRRLERLAARLRDEALPAPLEARLQAVLDALPAEFTAPAPAAASREPAPAAEAFTVQAGTPVHVWCDGSCAPNPGPGGWGALLEQDGRRMELSGAAPQSTNNIMEMTAAIEALRRTPEGTRVRVTTDSRYLMDGITRWLPGWKRKHWRKADGKPVLNQPLWQALDALVQKRHVRWEWVEGHSGHPENERCDELANSARRAQ
jgi:ribonuclease HI